MTMNLLRSRKSAPKRTRALPLFCPIFFGLALLSLIIVIVARRSEAFAVFFNRHVSGVVRAVLAFITNLFPFSVAELLIFLIPLFLFLLIRFAVKRRTDSWKSVLIYTLCLLSALSMIFTVFVFAYGVGYYVPTLDERLDLEAAPVSAEELAQTASWLIEKLWEYEGVIQYDENGASIMPYKLSVMSRKLMESYKTICGRYTFIQSMNSRIKPVLASVAMSYTHFTGVYTFFTGEANLNVDFPDYTLPYTAAHEFSHQRGISRENEANFIAFLVCAESEDLYIQYSAYLNLYEYVAVALYSADPALYAKVSPTLPTGARKELIAYSNFYDKYRDSTAGKVGTSVNNAFLQANGNKEGTKSYGMVVDLAVAYYKATIAEPS